MTARYLLALTLALVAFSFIALASCGREGGRFGGRFGQRANGTVDSGFLVVDSGLTDAGFDDAGFDDAGPGDAGPRFPRDGGRPPFDAGP